MMDRKYLLTYLKDGFAQFDWFETEEDMQDFIDSNNLDSIFESLKIIDSEDVEVNFKNTVK